jgi:four helix bundle protein
MGAKAYVHQELEVYQAAFAAAMSVFEESKAFPSEEKYSLTDQIRRASRSVCANLAEAWRKRRYPGAFVSKLSDAETEAAETQVWLEFAVRCKYLERGAAAALYRDYDRIIGTIVGMIQHQETWTLPVPSPRRPVTPSHPKRE